jgi:glutamate/tyrosine decarboxylase-like PLP-dependent enzyme
MNNIPRQPIAKDSPLFPEAEKRHRWDDHLTDILLQAEARVARGPVAPRAQAADLRRALVGFDFETPMEFGDLLEWTVARMEDGLVQLTHPRYLGLFNPAPTFPAQCADRIAAAFNPQLASATTSPAAVEIEAHVARALAKRAGLGKNAGGHFTSGGSEANGTALICALTRQTPGFAAAGSRAFAGQPVFYISQDSHLAWIKLAHQAGIGRDAARLVPTDGQGRMSMPALRAAIRGDKAQGMVPFMIVATAGTTNAGMVDPIAEAAEIARGEKIWFHVDAAWGGAAIASPRLRDRLAGMEAADSITIDGHKWFATTMGCGIFLTPHSEALSAAFDIKTSFMPSHESGHDPYLMSAQWSRRFSGLRLFLSLAAGGWDAYAKHVERGVALGVMFADEAARLGWQVRNQPGLGVVCVTPPENSLPVAKIVSAVVASGRAWVSVAKFEGRDTVRVCITNGRTTKDDVLDVANILDRARLGKISPLPLPSV